MSVHRPIVRSFASRFKAEAARHALAGGHSVYWETPQRAHLLFPVPDKDDLMDLGYWSVLDLGKKRWTEVTRGAFAGLATALVPRGCNDIVRRRAQRDSIHPGPTRRVDFDCLECGSCCRDNEVVLMPEDIERFEAAGRADLARVPLARRDREGRLVLTLLKSKNCRQLQSDNKCAIYTIRPGSCSEFPMGSECCLFAREVEMSAYDGLVPGETL